MYIPDDEMGFRIYWEDMNGKRNELFTSAFDEEQAVNEGIEYIRNNLYMASFTIVGLEQFIDRRWKKVEIKRVWCKGR